MLHFFSDVHLQEDEPEITKAFLEHLNKLQNLAPMQVFILGDLFEAWIGDDILHQPNPWLETIIHNLKTLSHRHKVYFQHGNRDFLIQEQFEQDTGIECLPEIYQCEFEGLNLILCHGDHLCTKDHDYMQFRHLVRNPAWQKEFLSKPIQSREAFANKARGQSKMSHEKKSATIMDVTQTAVEHLIQTHAADLLIHGHTHRPAIHSNTAKQEPNGVQTLAFQKPQAPSRIVLGDWRPHPSWLNLKAKDGQILIELQTSCTSSSTATVI